MRTMFPHKIGSAWEVHAPAKLNLYLDVLGSRADGFHELETLLVPVRIYDQLLWKASPSATSGASLRIRSFLQRGASETAPIDAGANNLVCRAAGRLAQASGIEPRGTFDLYKRIPVQAGLGGGSSDAAAALVLANAAWGIGYSLRRLAELAEEVGSDVPFFMSGGAAVCRGRGERVQPVAGLPPMHFVVVKPPASLSTAAVFGEWRHIAASRGGLAMLIELLRGGALAQAGRRMVNRLEAAAASLSPWIERILGELAKQSLCGRLMTGSGSACFGVARSARHARRVAKLLSGKDLGGVFATSSC
jgi:4-diphosphocytidyl-2-C-methyl-D-erythritol kinase